MHDTLGYFQRDPVYRKYHQNDLTFGILYAITTRISCCRLSTTRVVYGKGIAPPAGCRATTGRRSPICAPLFGFSGRSPARSCCSWAASSAQGGNGTPDTRDSTGIFWRTQHAGVQRLVRDLNTVYHGAPALHRATPRRARGFAGIGDDHATRVFAFDYASATGSPAGRGVAT